MMCHRSPLTVQGRSPLLLLLFIVLSSLSLSLSFSHPFFLLSLLLLFPPPQFFFFISFTVFPCLSTSFSRCLPRLSSFICPSTFIFLPSPPHSLSLFHQPSFMSFSSSIVLSEHLLSLPASAIFYLGLSSFLLLSFHLSLLSLQSISRSASLT